MTPAEIAEIIIERDRLRADNQLKEQQLYRLEQHVQDLEGQIHAINLRHPIRHPTQTFSEEN